MTSHPRPGTCDRRHPAPHRHPPRARPGGPREPPHDDTAPVEHDPTGMRALLASLPDPGPMPDDLVARISAALAAEARARRRHRAALGPRDDAACHRRPGADAAGRRRPGRAAAPPGRGCGTSGSRRPSSGCWGSAATSSGRPCPAASAASLESAGAARLAARRRTGEPAAAPRPAAPSWRPRRGPARSSSSCPGVDHAADRLDVTARELDDGTLDPIADLSRRVARARPDRDADRGALVRRRPRHPGRCRHPRRRRARSTASRRPSSSCDAAEGRTGLGGRPLLHHGQHRPHPWPGVARLSPAAPRAGRDRRGAAAAGTPRP